MRYFAIISYDGAPFQGWQVQPNGLTVQQLLEDAFSTVTRKTVNITAAGRTDTGVNARIMPAHMDMDAELTVTQINGLLRAVNAICRPAVVVNSLFPVAADAHARFDATSRTYRYFVHTKPSPFLRTHSLLLQRDVDFEAMNKAAGYILGTQDFTSFSKLHTQVKTNICTVTHAAWHTVDNDHDRRYLEITADRFLRNMVRAVVGTLLEVGYGKIAAEDVKRIIELRNRCKAGTSVPPYPLFLWQVDYPQNYDYPPIPGF